MVHCISRFWAYLLSQGVDLESGGLEKSGPGTNLNDIFMKRRQQYLIKLQTTPRRVTQKLRVAVKLWILTILAVT